VFFSDFCVLSYGSCVEWEVKPLLTHPLPRDTEFGVRTGAVVFDGMHVLTVLIVYVYGTVSQLLLSLFAYR